MKGFTDPHEESVHQKPEFVYVEPDTDYFEEHSQYFKSFENLENMRYPVALRVFIFAASIGVFVVACIVTFLFLLSLALYLLTWGKVESAHKAKDRLLRATQKLWVFVLGLVTGSLYPPFGLGIIVLYFMLRGEQIKAEWMEKFSQSGKSN